MLRSFRVPTPDLGVHQEMHPNELPPNALSDAENWLHRDGRMKVRRGFATVAQDTDQRPLGFTSYRDRSGTDRLVMGTTTSWWKFDAPSQQWVDITGVSWTGGVTDQVVFRVFEKASTTYLYGLNGKDVNKRWDQTAGAAVSQGGTPPIAKSMMILVDRMLLGNIISGGGYGGTISPMAIDVSANKDPDSGWGGSVLNVILADTPGEIVSMNEMGNLQGAIYKSDAIVMAIAQGANAPFRFEWREIGVPGPTSRNSVITLSDSMHLYLARDGSVRTFDGVESKSLGRHIQRYILNRFDINSIARSFGVWDGENEAAWFFFTGLGSTDPNRGVVIEMGNRSIWPINFDTLRVSAGIKALLPGGVTIGQLVGPAPYGPTVGDMTLTLGEYDPLGQILIFGDVGGQVYKESGTTDAGSNIPAFFTTGLSDLGDSTRFKTLYELEHLFLAGGAQNVDIRLISSNYGEDTTDGATQTLDVGNPGPYSTGHREAAKRFGLEIEVAATQSIQWDGADAHFVFQGDR